MLEASQFPPIQSTRDAADARTPPVTGVRCESCKHSIDFQSRGEMVRFLETSKWIRTETETLRCPVCVDRIARGIPVEQVRPRFGLSQVSQ